MKLKRIFIALVPPSSIQSAIYTDYSRQLNAEWFKIVPEKNLHLTLFFLGYVGEEKLREIRHQLRELEARPSIHAGVGAPGMFHNRVVWVGIREGADAIRQLVQEMAGMLGLEAGSFHPHLTIARFRKNAPPAALEQARKLVGTPVAEIWPVKSVELMESRLTQEGPVYKVLAQFPFK